MLKPKPYFMKNPEWYKFNKRKHKFVLTKKAPKEAIQSYKEFYEDEFDFTCQAILADITRENRKELISLGLTEIQADELLKVWNSPNNNKSYNELKKQALKELNSK